MPESRPATPRAVHRIFALLPACLALVLCSVGTTPAAEPDAAQSEAAKSEAAKPDAAGLELFEKSVRPLLVQHCYDCHSGDDVNGGLALDTRDGLRKGGDSGPAVTPGEPDKSLLIEAVRYKNLDLQMPPEGVLPAADIAALEKWVAMGAPDPREPAADTAADAAAPQAIKPVGMSVEDGRDFWSFQPVADPPVPAVKNAGWVRTPIDAFVLAKLESNGLAPAPPADRRTLIRRVTFDLTGLPPTPAEVDAFLADESPDAFAKVVERLLESPAYGVRWGRHWLDVARYADSNGLDENLAFGNAWRYRDYVVDAFNEDKPFDRFLVEQIAGDLVPGADRETKTATGFLALGAKVLAEPDREKLVMDTIDEQIDATGKAFLGMTLGCVRCHDHKFDPIQQTDYYALAAIFKSTRTFADSNTGAIKHWYEHPLTVADAPAVAAETMKAIEAEISKKKSAASSFKSQAVARLRADSRAKATDYLVAAAGFDTMMPLTQVEAIARPLGLHARILYHCRRHLEFHKDDALFGKWHELAAAGDVAGIEKHYRPLFEGAEAALVAAKKENPKATKLTDPQLEAARVALYDASGFLAVPAKPEHALDPETLAEYNRLAEEARVLESGAPDAPAAMGVSDGTVLTSLPVHIRGSHRNLGEPVKRAFPAVMRTSTVAPVFPRGQSGRLELAQWMASTQHPLTARVYVNRIWRWHFGTGIVSTTENFGLLGDRPSHPELLDWLARRFMESGWSTKAMNRLILASNVYQMASSAERNDSSFRTPVRSDKSQSGPQPATPNAQQVDPENRLLWRFNLQRLEAEQIRDSLLAVSGRLDQTLGGKTVPLRNRQFVFDHTSIDHTKYDSLRRAIYLPVIRNNVYTLFEQFDFPDPTMPTGDRNATVVAPQALLMMNAPVVMDSADALAELLLAATADEAGRVRLAYERTVGRPPTDAETQRALAFIGDVGSQTVTATGGQQPSRQDAERQAWSLFCQSLFASNEFIFVR